MNKTDKNSCSCGDILLERQTGNMLEGALGGSVEQDKGDQCWEVGGGGVLLSGRDQGGSP